MPNPTITYASYTVDASPVDATEIVVAHIDSINPRFAFSPIGLQLLCQVAPAAAATAVVVKFREDSLTGTQIGTTTTIKVPGGAGADTNVAVLAVAVLNPAGALGNKTIVATVTMTAAATASTVTALAMTATTS